VVTDLQTQKVSISTMALKFDKYVYKSNMLYAGCSDGELMVWNIGKQGVFSPQLHTQISCYTRDDGYETIDFVLPFTYQKQTPACLVGCKSNPTLFVCIFTGWFSGKKEDNQVIKRSIGNAGLANQCPISIFKSKKYLLVAAEEGIGIYYFNDFIDLEDQVTGDIRRVGAKGQMVSACFISQDRNKTGKWVAHSVDKSIYLYKILN